MIKPSDCDQRHGGPFDRGVCDSYYQRGINPHYFLGKTNMSDKVIASPGSDEHEQYLAGYFWNEHYGDKKDWGYDD